MIVEGDDSNTDPCKAAGNGELAEFILADGDIILTGDAQAKSLLKPADSGSAVLVDFFDRLLAFNRVRLRSW